MWFLLPLAVLGAYFWKKNKEAAELPPGEPEASTEVQEPQQAQTMMQQLPPGFMPEPALKFAPEQRPMTVPATPKLQQSALMKLVSMTATRPKLQAVGKVPVAPKPKLK